MKTVFGIIAAFAIFPVILVGIGLVWWVSTYNSLVAKSEGVNASWGQVQNVYQRRTDLIPNLVATVKGYAAHESGTLEKVIAARQEVVNVQVDGNKLASDPEAQKQFVQAQQGLSSALSGLRVTMERYPDLKANQNFLALQSQLEGTENRIAVERQNNQLAVADYNKSVQSFLTGFVARRYNYGVRPYFTATAGSEVAPTVNFK